MQNIDSTLSGFVLGQMILNHWGRVTHMCVINVTIIGSDYGLLPGRCQAIIWTIAGILSIGPWKKLQWNFDQKWYIFIKENAFKNDVCKMVTILSRPHFVLLTGWGRCVYIFHLVNPPITKMRGGCQNLWRLISRELCYMSLKLSYSLIKSMG